MKPSAKRQRRELETVPIIDANISPEIFFSSYVMQRAPVKFNTLIMDESWKGDKWTNKILREKSGDAILRVERRNGPNDSFGLGNEDKMTFNSFIDSLENDCETSYYLTTQELSYTHEGQPSLTSPPVDGLIGDFPWLPKLCGNLVPQNINLWFGSSKLPTSSGLHHDFHDNLYLLLRGEKKITLFSPDEAHNMYTVGEIVKIHPNGRINYKDQLTNADGSDEASLIALRASADLDIAADLLANAEEEDAELAEQRIEDALEALLDAEIAGNDDESEGDDDDDDEDDEDFVDDENAGFEPLNMLRGMIEEEEDSGDEGQDNGADDYVDSDEEGNQVGTSTSTLNGKTSGSGSGSSSRDAMTKKKTKEIGSESEKVMEISVTNASSHSLAGPSTSIKSPPNFSKVETSLPLDELALRYPLYFEALTSSRSKSSKGERADSSPRGDSDSSSSSSSSSCVSQSTSNDKTLKGDSITSDSTSSTGARCFEVTITAGQMLYIPAGWFHEVRSTGGGSEGHLALNYWFHPPDGSTFEKPYSSNFWPSDWEKRNMK